MSNFGCEILLWNHFLIKIDISVFCTCKSPGKSANSGAMTPPLHLDYTLAILFSTQRNQSSLGKCLISSLGQKCVLYSGTCDRSQGSYWRLQGFVKRK